jgi:hypothetical protein
MPGGSAITAAAKKGIIRSQKLILDRKRGFRREANEVRHCRRGKRTAFCISFLLYHNGG